MILPRFTILSSPGGQHSQLHGSGPGCPSVCCVIPLVPVIQPRSVYFRPYHLGSVLKQLSPNSSAVES